MVVVWGSAVLALVGSFLKVGSPLAVLPLVALRLGGAAALLRAALLCFQAMECTLRLACWYYVRPFCARCEAAKLEPDSDLFFSDSS